MKQKLIFLFCLLLTLPFTTVDAQRNKHTTAKKKKAKTALQDENPKFTSMLESLAKVTIIDSTVVDSAQFLKAIYTNHEEGRLTTYQEFFKKEGDGIVYVNELGNRCIYSQKDEQTGSKLLYQSDLLSDGWTEGEPLEGADGNFGLYDFDCPYLMPDGVTLYFCARGSDGLGGYDIYRTRIDDKTRKILRPENLGLPFNSERDDYMYVIDEQNQLAYFVSNRRQPNGKTCVYTFIPFESRSTVTADEDKLRSLARIDRIADTWGNHTDRDAALQRKRTAMENAYAQSVRQNEPEFQFVINDETTYTSMNDFRAASSRTQAKELQDVRKKLTSLEQALIKKRNYYRSASSLERRDLRKEILKDEQQVTAYYKKIHTLEKNIRNAENR